MCWRGEKPEAGGARVAALVSLALAAPWGELFEEELTFQHRQSSLRKDVGEAIGTVAKRKPKSCGAQNGHQAGVSLVATNTLLSFLLPALHTGANRAPTGH